MTDHLAGRALPVRIAARDRARAKVEDVDVPRPVVLVSAPDASRHVPPPFAGAERAVYMLARRSSFSQNTSIVFMASTSSS